MSDLTVIEERGAEIKRLKKALSAKDEQIRVLREGLEPIRPYFKSGNSEKIERATIPAILWEKVEEALKSTAAGGGV